MAAVPGSGKRRQKVLAFFRGKPPTQWQGDGAFFWGTTGCSATVVKALIKLWTGKDVTLTEIAKAAHYPDRNQRENTIGLYDHQVVAVLAHFGVRYEYTTDLSYRELMKVAVRKGPVAFACTYGFWPQRKGARYGGLVANGRPNGYAQADGQGGKDQLSGFENGRHMGLLLSKRHKAGTPDRATKVYLWDPNHGSRIRPLVPSYDVVTPNQWRNLYASARATSKNHKVMALVPLGTL